MSFSVLRLTLMTVSVLVASSTLSGCVVKLGDEASYGHGAHHEVEERRNRQVLASLELGTPVAVVQQRLGEPAFTEAFERNGATVRVLRYRTHRSHSDGDTTHDETTALVFIDGLLSGLGETAYREVVANYAGG